MSEPLLWWGFALLVGALLVLLAELFVPSGGMLSILAAAFTVGGVVCFFRVSTTAGVAATGVVIALTPLVAYFFLKIYPDTPMGRRLILGDPEGRPERDADEDDAGGGAPDADGAGGIAVGATGVALTDLRPVGTVEIGSRRVEATSEFGLIRAGESIRVVANDAGRIRVRQ